MSGGGNFQGNQGGGNLPPGVNQTGTATGGPYIGGGSSSWGGNNPQQIASRTFNYPSMGFQNPMSQYGNMPGNYGWSPSYGYPNGGYGYNNTPPQQTAATQAPAQNTTTQAPAGPTAWGDNANLGQAQRFANAGQFGRARQQVMAGGGNWDDYGSRLRTEAGADKNYGGDWDWGKASEDQVSQAQRFANQGMYGQSKRIMGDNWNKGMSQQFRAEESAAPDYVKGASMGFDWGDVGDKRLAQSKAFAQQGKFGKAKSMFTGGVKGKSQGTWDKNTLRQMKAWHQGNK